MIEEHAQIERTEGSLAAVSGAGSVSCGGCNAQQGCGTASLARFFQRRERLLWVRNTVAAKPGDRVVVGLDERVLLRSAFIAYGLPIAGLLVGAMLGDSLANPLLKEPSAVLAGLTGLIVGLIVSRKISRHLANDERNQATVIRVLASGYRSNIKGVAVAAADLDPGEKLSTEKV